MATRTLLKLKPNLNLPLRFFRNPTFALTRSVAPLTRPDSASQISLFRPSTVQFPGALARQMATARSPRGASKSYEDDDDDDDDDEDVDDGDEDVFDLDDEFDDSDGDEDFEDEEEEKPKGKKKTH